MKNIILLVFIVMMSMKGCDKNSDLSREQEQHILNEMYTEIQALANSEQCTNAGNWAFTAIGAKACGGPVAYIAYSLNIDTESFLEKVEKYTAEQDKFNKKWNLISDCSIPPSPTAIECVDGAPDFIY